MFPTENEMLMFTHNSRNNCTHSETNSAFHLYTVFVWCKHENNSITQCIFVRLVLWRNEQQQNLLNFFFFFINAQRTDQATYNSLSVYKFQINGMQPRSIDVVWHIFDTKNWEIICNLSWKIYPICFLVNPFKQHERLKTWIWFCFSFQQTEKQKWWTN